MALITDKSGMPISAAEFRKGRGRATAFLRRRLGVRRGARRRLRAASPRANLSR